MKGGNETNGGYGKDGAKPEREGDAARDRRYFFGFLFLLAVLLGLSATAGKKQARDLALLAAGPGAAPAAVTDPGPPMKAEAEGDEGEGDEGEGDEGEGDEGEGDEGEARMRRAFSGDWVTAEGAAVFLELGPEGDPADLGPEGNAVGRSEAFPDLDGAGTWIAVSGAEETSEPGPVPGAVIQFSVAGADGLPKAYFLISLLEEGGSEKLTVWTFDESDGLKASDGSGFLVMAEFRRAAAGE